MEYLDNAITWLRRYTEKLTRPLIDCRYAGSLAECYYCTHWEKTRACKFIMHDKGAVFTCHTSTEQL